MFNLSMGASDAGQTTRAWEFFDATAAQVRVWLNTEPDAAELVTHLPALELALAAHVKNQDARLLTLASGALARISTDTDFETLENVTLAGLIGLNLRAFLVTQAVLFEGVARRAIEAAKARFDDKDGFFKVSAADTSKRFEAEANTLLGEVFYFAWRLLDDQTLRPIAGEILGQVSAYFDPSPRFSDHEPPELVTTEAERRELAVIAAAMQLFLTAGETTGRRSYLPRAAIVADAALENLAAMQGHATAQAGFANALVRLGQFTGEARYSSAARSMLQEVATNTQANIDAANIALALVNAEQFPLHIVIVGDVENDGTAQAMWFAAMREYAVARVIEALHPTQHAVRIAQWGYAATNGHAAAHICVGPICLPAVASVDALQKAMSRARAL